MLAVDNILVSEEVIERRFVCDLNACKGQCCVDGDAGAPLEEAETAILDDIYEKVKPYMQLDGIKAVEKQGTYEMDIDGDLVTPLVEGKHCAYVVFDTKGIAKCAIEMAYNDGVVDFPKPISCHLYPIRVQKLSFNEALNYHKWQVCRPACKCGEALNVPVYKFLQAPLTRKYGKEWFDKLTLMADLWEKEMK